eukprot:TRINITY_DN3626_c0_g1_i1.p1 TRINITY_DN3626_c0_g1~~TRINITY_DN3626_c0_g1_i1.p1  ORF type:complete len:2436 (-),score=328.82 TRINITY_DN3626_c0_g1_i1:104-7411(-)
MTHPAFCPTWNSSLSNVFVLALALTNALGQPSKCGAEPSKEWPGNVHGYNLLQVIASNSRRQGTSSSSELEVWTEQRLENMTVQGDPTRCYIGLFLGKTCESAGGIYQITPSWYDNHAGGPAIHAKCGKVSPNWGSIGSHPMFADALTNHEDFAGMAAFVAILSCANNVSSTTSMPTVKPVQTSPEPIGTTSAAPITTTSRSAPTFGPGEPRSQAADAQFLIQATFGPTRSSLQQLRNSTYEAWIRNQISMPASTHRDYYRERANPHLFNATNPVGRERDRCSKGSRWHALAFSLEDLGKDVLVRRSQVWVAGSLRTELSGSIDMPYAWADDWKGSCADFGEEDVSSETGCRAACDALMKVRRSFQARDSERAFRILFTSFSWRHSPGCSLAVAGNLAGHCHWNTNENARHISTRYRYLRGRYHTTQRRPLCVKPMTGTTTAKLMATTADRNGLNKDSAWHMLSIRAKICYVEEFMSGIVQLCSRSFPESQQVHETLPNPLMWFRMPSDAGATTTTTTTTASNCFQANSKFSPINMPRQGRTVTSSAADCQQRCSSVSGCAHFSWWPDGGCHIQNFDALRKSNNRVTAGPPSCPSTATKTITTTTTTMAPSVSPSVQFTPLRPGVLLLKESVSNCGLVEFVHSTAEDPEGRYYRYAPRLQLVDNERGSVSVPMSMFNEGGCKVIGELVHCSSPGEVANDPFKGHEAIFHSAQLSPLVAGDVPLDVDLAGEFTEYFGDRAFDIYDGSVPWDIPPDSARSSVWLMQALYSEDQLRQRMAWALSQILVTSAEGTDYGLHSEMWMNYYDILVRHALGSFGDLLREVTFSPVMGMYLTHLQNKAYDASGSLPDENYAREIMQLFTIGEWKLHPDGSRVIDSEGSPMRTYTNEHITSLARVFTGLDNQPARSNIEMVDSSTNYIDPMQMRAEWHDIHPKPDLDGGYFGDGYPRCSDLPAHAHLAKGAKYVFRSGVRASDTRLLQSSNDSGWMPMGSGDRACRGANAQDNRGSYYIVFAGLHSIEDCKNECREVQACQGIEHNSASGRCEVWTRSAGIQASIALSGYSCLRYTKPALATVQAAFDARTYHACIGTAVHLTWNGFHDVQEMTSASCSSPDVGLAVFPDFEAAGYEHIFKLDELSAAPGTTRYFKCSAHCRNDSNWFAITCPASTTLTSTSIDASTWSLVDGGIGRACRGANAQDNRGSYYIVFAGLHSIEDCKKKCREAQACQGIEHNSASGRCEVWTRAEGIHASIALSGYMCLRYAALPTTWATTATTTATTATTTKIVGGALLVQPGTALFSAFCPEGSCNEVAASVVLDTPVPCLGADCGVEFVSEVVVDGKTYEYVPPACVHSYFSNDTAVELDPDGSVRAQVSGQNKVKVNWQGRAPVGCPSNCKESEEMCVCTAFVKSRPVFSQIPDKANLQDKLKIGSHIPSTACTMNCAGEVKAYSPSGAIDEKTVFEHGGQFFKNAEELVDIAGFTFRNPPSFMPQNMSGSKQASTKAALDEIESVHKTLVHHPNTAMFIAYRLLQRLVTSNPSPEYVETVADAFKSGSFNGTKYTGQFGDLGASAAAIFLHPEARNMAPIWGGKLREPILKTVHFLRSMEFKATSAIVSHQYEEIGSQVWCEHNSDSLIDANVCDGHTNCLQKGKRWCDLKADCLGIMWNPTWSQGKSFKWCTSSELVSKAPLFDWFTYLKKAPASLESSGAADTPLPSSASPGASGHMVVMKNLAKVVGQFPYQSPTVFNFYDPSFGINPKSSPERELPVEGQCSIMAYERSGSSFTSTRGPCGPYTSSSWTDTCKGIDTIIVPTGCVIEVASAVGGRGRKWGPFSMNVAVQRTRPRIGYDRIRSIRIVQQPIATTTTTSHTTTTTTVFNRTDLVGPEFQIFDTPSINGFTDAMVALVHNQGLSSCDRGFGIDSISCAGALRPMNYQGSIEEVWAEMDLLLTGDRLGPLRKTLMEAGRSPNEVRNQESNATLAQVKDAQYSVLLSPQFHTLGDVTPQWARTRPNRTTPPSAVTDYKAVVILYMFGGADTFNMLVPMDCDLYDQYVSIRRGVALSPEQLISVDTTGQACSKFGIHTQLPILKELYDMKEAAFVTNVGNLIRPRAGCPGNFGHNSMQHASQTLVCQDGTSLMHGGGGRMADALAAGSTLGSITSFSLAGTAPWSEGISTKRSVVSGNQVSGGGDDSRRPPKVQQVIDKLTTIEFSTVYAKEYIHLFEEALDSAKTVSEALEQGDGLLELPEQDYGGIGELRQVARLIGSRQLRQAGRDFYFVGFGGFDNHANLAPRLANRFGTMEVSIRAFVNEMKAQGVWENVVFATQSDFARTLDPNGNMGSDHGWAANHFVLSGAIDGGRVLNEFPALFAGNSADVGRGRLIPDYPYESYMAPIAEWLGVQASQLSSVFPNLPNFNSSMVLLPDLFKRSQSTSTSTSATV